MSNAHSSTLNDGQRPWIYCWRCDDDLMSPDDGFDKLLPIAAPREQEHQRECPHEMRSQEEKAVCTGGRSVRLNDLGRLRPEEIPKPPIDC